MSVSAPVPRCRSDGAGDGAGHELRRGGGGGRQGAAAHPAGGGHLSGQHVWYRPVSAVTTEPAHLHPRSARLSFPPQRAR